MCHEVLEICDMYSELTEVKCSHSEVEFPLHRELHSTVNINITETVTEGVEFIAQQSDPYLLQK